MSQILCAIDFSEPSLRSLKWASNLSGKLQTPLDILFTYRLTLQSQGVSVLEHKRHLEQEARKKFKTIEELIKEVQPAKYDFSVEVGFLQDRIKEKVLAAPYHLVVIPNHMTEQLLSGGIHSSTHEVIRDLRVPVLFHE